MESDSMIYYILNQNNEIVQDDFVPFANAVAMPKENYKIVNGYNGALFFEEYTKTEEYRQKERAWQANHRLNELRNQRVEECFPVINRGYLWYMQLSESQMQEMNAWYQAWLDVTVTQTIPQKPEWL